MSYIIIGTDGDYGWYIEPDVFETLESATEQAKWVALHNARLTKIIIVDEDTSVVFHPKHTVDIYAPEE